MSSLLDAVIAFKQALREQNLSDDEVISMKVPKRIFFQLMHECDINSWTMPNQHPLATGKMKLFGMEIYADLL